MDKLVKPSRLLALALLLAALIGIYVVSLYKLQIVEGAAYSEASRNSVVSTRVVPAARGNIMDRYGRVLVSNRTCNNLLINSDELFALDDDDTWDKANAAILELVNTVEACGDTYTDELPVTKDSPFTYTEMTDVQRARLQAFLENAGLDQDASAVELMSYFRTRYKIDNSYSARQMRIIAGIRYEINIRYIIPTSDYVFAQDVSIELITRLMENNVPAFEVETSYVREYNTTAAAHLLGYIGMMNEKEAEYYGDRGYKFNALVGKDGVEYAFEDYLHGVDGEAKVTRTASGTITSTVYTQEPQPGDNVYLTIDLNLQEAAERALDKSITAMNDERRKQNEEIEQYGGAEEDIQQLIDGGAVVAVKVKTGEPLAIASWPTYNLPTIMEDYDEIVAAENAPLFNRALNGIYAPGSTFKPCTAIAALNEGIISTTSTVTCEGKFRKYEDAGYAPNCWIYPGQHGPLTVTNAIKVSCNYFFYTVGDFLGIDRLSEYALQFGLGTSTGIELPEDTGHMSTQDLKMELEGLPWYNGDTIAAAIGQSYSQFTPLQLAEYCAAVANGGTRHSASLLKAVRSYDYSEKVFQRDEEVLNVVEAPAEYYSAVQEGMYLVANNFEGSAYETFGDYGYCHVAAKTGTAQVGSKKTNTAVFICYAPYEDPEIAVAVVVEKGAAGKAVAGIARDVLDAYFGLEAGSRQIDAELTLLR